MRLDSSGRLGLGTSSPDNTLTVNGTIAWPYSGAAVMTGNFVQRKYIWSAYTTRDTVNFGVPGADGGTGADATTPRMTIDSLGRVGIGVTTVGSPLHVKANSTEGIRIESPDYSSIYGLVTSRRNSNTPLEISAVQTVGTLDASISFSRSTNGTTFAESGRWDKDGRLLVGTSTARSNFFNATISPTLQCEATAGTAGGGTISTVYNSNDTSSNAIIIGKTRATSTGGVTAVQSGDDLGFLSFQGADGTELVEAARISASVDGTPGADDMPGRLVFSVTKDGQSSPTEAMRINNAGFVLVGTQSNAENYGFNYKYNGGITNGLYVASTATSGDGSFLTTWSRGYTINNTSPALYYTEPGATRFEVRNNGGIANYSANNVNLSDRNAKKDIEPAAGTWDCLKEWEIVNFRYKDQPDDADLNMGVIAQQVAESCPEVITVFQEAKEATEDQPAQEERLGVKDQQMVWMAIKALQEAQLRIETLEAKVAALEGV
jgi:hypothetical protein